MDHQWTGVLLAGGASRRFGRPKAFEIYHGFKYYEASLQALQAHCQTIYIVSHPSLKESFERAETVPVIEDLPTYQGRGPLAGLYTVMHTYNSSWYLTAPCDAPLLKSEIYDLLLSHRHLDPQTSAIIPVVNGRRQPLIGLYARSCMPVIQALLDEGTFKVGALFERVRTKFVEDSSLNALSRAFTNINEEKDLQQL
ncbi:molybdenum cofactor guanylyltransferase [Halalkalibacterium ligniniphilum]|uniref:molybdenum cofactor guanylyltransferase n=1 Tax=Halalkalibacterium ligniniphilum TaxID=1134413 RepID=UPI0003460F04|nr:molybdenum cofactor guanylyltransferase [Halalkalibacterium ligniniphilum]